MLKCSTWNNTPAAARVVFSGRCHSGAQDPTGRGVGVQAHESEGTARGVEEEPARLVGIYERVYFVNESSGKNSARTKIGHSSVRMWRFMIGHYCWEYKYTIKCVYLLRINQRGARAVRAEIIPSKPDADNTDVGIESHHADALGDPHFVKHNLLQHNGLSSI